MSPRRTTERGARAGSALSPRLEDHGSFALYKLPANGGQPRRILSLPVAPRFIDWAHDPRAQRRAGTEGSGPALHCCVSRIAESAPIGY